MSPYHIPGNELERLEGLKTNGGAEGFGSFYRNYGMPNYFDLYGIKYLAGDPNVRLNVPEKRYTIINKMASDLLGFTDPDLALGKNINVWDRDKEIVAVVDDYHQQSLHHPVVPIIYDFSSDNLMEDGYYSFAITPGTDKNQLIAALKKAYQKDFPYTVFEPIDVSEHYASQYQSDEHFKQLNIVFTILGVIIASMGMLGLMMITIGKRSKEISIRKILGANITSITSLLLQDTVKIILISMLLAAPLSYYLMNQWLQNFSYHVEVSAWIYLLTGALALGFSFVTVGYLSVKAALVNPVETLREE